MTEPQQHPDFVPDIGLCSVCDYARIIKHPRGGRSYHQCLCAQDNPALDKFPAIPVPECDEFRQRDTDE